MKALVVQSCLTLCDPRTPGTVARQAPLSMGFSRQEYWNGLPFLTPQLKWCSHKPLQFYCQNHFLPLCPQADFGCLSFMGFISFCDVLQLFVYLYFCISQWHLTEDKDCATVLNQEMNIRSLNETKPKKNESNTCAYSDVTQIYKKKYRLKLISFSNAWNKTMGLKGSFGCLTIIFKGHESWPQGNHSNSAYTGQVILYHN